METLDHKEVINLLLQLASILILARVFAEIARKFKQPAVVGEIFAGIILGPTILGNFFPGAHEYLFASNECRICRRLCLSGILRSQYQR